MVVRGRSVVESVPSLEKGEEGRSLSSPSFAAAASIFGMSLSCPINFTFPSWSEKKEVLQLFVSHLSFFSDMAVQNCIGDSFRGATWVALHNGGGTGW